MSVSMTSARDIARPTPEKITSTILDHFPLVQVDHFGLMNNKGVWPSFNCMDTLSPTSMCPDPLATEDGTRKIFTGSQWVPAYDFAVYGGAQCANIGLDAEDMKSEVKRIFEANRAKGIEQSLLGVRFIATGSDDPTEGVLGWGQWDDPVDLTPATGVSLVVALGLLEGDAAANYAGLPTIHMPRAAATVLESHGLITWDGNKAYTKNGSRVVMGGGYDDPDMLASGKWDMYATGEVYIEASEEVNVSAYVIPGDGLGAYALANPDEPVLADNDQVVLAEQMFRVAIDCYLSKVTATVWS